MVVGEKGNAVVSEARSSYGTFLTRLRDDPVYQVRIAVQFCGWLN
jgi:hypothetical protein